MKVKAKKKAAKKKKGTQAHRTMKTRAISVDDVLWNQSKARAKAKKMTLSKFTREALAAYGRK